MYNNKLDFLYFDFNFISEYPGYVFFPMQQIDIREGLYSSTV